VSDWPASPQALLVTFRFTGTAGEIIEILTSLIAAGADLNATDDHGRTILFSPNVLSNLGVLRFLVAKGADPRHIDLKGHTILHSYLQRSNVSEGVVKAMVNEYGVDINAQNHEGLTALYLSIFCLSLKDVELLVNVLKADVTPKSNTGLTVHKRYSQMAGFQGHHKNYNEISGLLCGQLPSHIV
jgi:ankyrin repeat protein